MEKCYHCFYTRSGGIGRNIIPQLGNRNEEDSTFLHDLLSNIEISTIFLSKIYLQPLLVI
jgi:hypothetical protein